MARLQQLVEFVEETDATEVHQTENGSQKSTDLLAER